jgi:hypothetical protein
MQWPQHAELQVNGTPQFSVNWIYAFKFEYLLMLATAETHMFCFKFIFYEKKGLSDGNHTGMALTHNSPRAGRFWRNNCCFSECFYSLLID